MKVKQKRQCPKHGWRWTNAENMRLRLLFQKRSVMSLTDEFGRTFEAIVAHARILGLKKDASKGYRGPDRTWRKWTTKDIDFLREYHKSMSYLDIAAAMGRNRNSVAIESRRLGLRGFRKEQGWADEKKEQLKKIYREHSIKELAEIFGCSKNAVLTQARKLALSKKVSTWTNEEIRYLTKNYRLMTSTQLAKHIKHPPQMIRVKANSLGIRKRNQWHWTEKEIKYLRRHYKKKTVKSIAKKLGRNIIAVKLKARQTGFRPPDFPGKRQSGSASSPQGRTFG